MIVVTKSSDKPPHPIFQLLELTGPKNRNSLEEEQNKMKDQKKKKEQQTKQKAQPRRPNNMWNTKNGKQLKKLI